MNKICDVCEEEVTCEWVNEGIETTCCSCNDTEVQKRCSSCFGDYCDSMVN